MKQIRCAITTFDASIAYIKNGWPQKYFKCWINLSLKFLWCIWMTRMMMSKLLSCSQTCNENDDCCFDVLYFMFILEKLEHEQKINTFVMSLRSTLHPYIHKIIFVLFIHDLALCSNLCKICFAIVLCFWKSRTNVLFVVLSLKLFYPIVCLNSGSYYVFIYVYIKGINLWKKEVSANINIASLC